jgi:hypothetical protein
LKIFLGKVRPFTSPAEGHPQGLIIAPGVRAKDDHAGALARDLPELRYT